MSIAKIDTIIALSGRIHSGKSTVAKMLSKKFSIPIASFGKYLIAYCKQRELSVDRNTLQDVGQDLVETNPVQFLENVIEYSIEGNKAIILDGIRHKVIFDAVKNFGKNVITIFVEADLGTRYQRYLSRIRIDFEAFLALDNHPVELETESLKPLCDFVLDSKDTFTEKFDSLISNIRGKIV